MLVQLLHGSECGRDLLSEARIGKATRDIASQTLHNIVHSHDDERAERQKKVLGLLKHIRAHCEQMREDLNGHAGNTYPTGACV